MIEVDIENFNGSYSSLNGKKKDLDISLFSLVRSAITMGYNSYGSVANAGLFRAAKLLGLVLGDVTTKNGYLKISDQFMNFERSEKVADSYYLGQALTKAVAEELLNIPWLMHVSKYQGIYNIKCGSKLPAKYKVKKNSTKHKNAKEPDFFGFDSKFKAHVFEAKGYSSGKNNDTLQHAIDQVSQVTTINGKPPETRVACFFELLNTKIKGRIIDPMGSEGMDIKIDTEKYLRNYYNYFNDNITIQKNSIEKEIEGNVYILNPIYSDFNETYYYGLDKMIFERINSGNASMDGLNEGRDFKNIKEDEEYSIGLDGIILYNEKI